MTPQHILRADVASIARSWLARDGRREPHCTDITNLERYVNDALTEVEAVGYAPDYAEPGYVDDPRPEWQGRFRGVLLANWNYFSDESWRLLERYGFELEWSDEWRTCYDCDNAYRIEPDCLGWLPAWVEPIDGSGEDLCLECARSYEDAAGYDS